MNKREFEAWQPAKFLLPVTESQSFTNHAKQNKSELSDIGLHVFQYRIHTLVIAAEIEFQKLIVNS